MWPSYPSETSGPGNAVDATIDWNNARKFNATWENKALSAAAITMVEDGKYALTYSGAQNLDTISGLSDGRIAMLRADVSGAGGNLTIRSGQGNIKTQDDIPIVLSDDTDTCLCVAIGSTVKVSFQ